MTIISALMVKRISVRFTLLPLLPSPPTAALHCSRVRSPTFAHLLRVHDHLEDDDDVEEGEDDDGRDVRLRLRRLAAFAPRSQTRTIAMYHCS